MIDRLLMEVYNEKLACVGSPNQQDPLSRASMPILKITAWPDRLPTSPRAMNLTFAHVKSGARYDHNYLALPAVMTGQCLLVAPEIIVSDLVRGGVLHVVPGSRTFSGMRYRAYAVDRSDNSENPLGFLRVARASLQKGPPSQKPRDVA